MRRLMSVVLVGALSTSFVFAASKSKEKDLTVKPQLILNQVKIIKAQESEGDELYLTLSARVANKPTEYIRIPAKPEHWFSRKIETVKQVSLWSEPLTEGQSVTVVLELNEQDALPLNPDDLLGVMRLKLKNEKGRLQAEWDVPNRTDSVIKVFGEKGDVHQFNLQNAGAHYEVYLSLKK